MNKLQLKEIPTDVPLQKPLYHASGYMLHDRSERLSRRHVAMMRSFGFDCVYEPQSSYDLIVFRRDARMETVPVEELPLGRPLARAIYDKDGTLLLDQGVPLTPEAIHGFHARGFNYIRRIRADVAKHAELIKQYHAALQTQAEPAEQEIGMLALPPFVAGAHFAPRDIIANPQGKLNSITVERLFTPDMSTVRPRLPALVDSTHALLPAQRPVELKKAAVESYLQLFASARRLFDRLLRDDYVNDPEVASIARHLIASLVHDRYLHSALTQVIPREDATPNHSVMVAATAVSIATALGYSVEQVYEVAWSALLHDVGMMKVPAHILQKRGALSLEERLYIERHPVYGFDFLSKIRNLPRIAPLVSYQSHERLDGSGYPKQRKGPSLHFYSRIVAIADTYVAMISPRAWRKALLPYEAMEQLLRETSRGKFDRTALRAFLDATSLFPLGSWVQLSDQRIAQVVAAQEGHHTRPTVAIPYAERISSHAPIIDLRMHPNIKIIKALRQPNDASDPAGGF